MKALSYMLLAGATLLTACKKDKSNSNDPSLLLTATAWKPALTDKNTATNPQGDKLYYAWQNCEKDDLYTFGNNGTLTINTSQQHCTTNEAAAVQNTYSVDMSANTVTIKGVTYHLTELSSTQLKYYIDIPQTSGFQHLIYIYEH